MVPKSYQQRDGGSWKQWTLGPVNASDLAKKVDPDTAGCYIYGLYVFALFFENQRVWNCQTGWQTKGML